MLQARKQGVVPQEVVDKFHKENKEVFARFGISFDAFERTSSALHHEVARDFFKNLYDKGLFRTIESEQFYDEVEKTFLADRYLQGTCSHCGFEEAYGDQCEACGRDLSPEELKHPISKLSGTIPVRKRTRHWYLPMNEYAEFLAGWLSTKKDWKPNVYGQCMSWLSQGLQPRAMTRDLDWGVAVPLAEAKGKVLYVWFEAPIGYISATQEWAKREGVDWRVFWQDEKTRLVHFIGKDNIVFHCLLFPSMLKAHGGYILPHYVCGNEFMNLESRKISTSRGHAVWLKDYLVEYPGKEDVLRYVLCANLPETKDSNFRWDDFKDRNNQELVATLGNFVNRVFVLVHKYLNGRVPVPGDFSEVDRATMECIAGLPLQIGTCVESFKFKKGLECVMEFARVGNKYLADTAPWHMMGENKEGASTVLYVAMQIIGHIALYGLPYLPFTAEKLQGMLGFASSVWDDAYVFEKVKPGMLVADPVLIFEKII